MACVPASRNMRLKLPKTSVVKSRVLIHGPSSTMATEKPALCKVYAATAPAAPVPTTT